MALCSCIFAVSSRYSSIASMILSAYTDDDKGQKSPQHIPSSQDTATEGLIRKLPNRLTHFNKDGWQSAKQHLETSLVFLFSLLSNLQGGDEVFWIQVKTSVDTWVGQLPGTSGNCFQEIELSFLQTMRCSNRSATLCPWFQGRKSGFDLHLSI